MENGVGRLVFTTDAAIYLRGICSWPQMKSSREKLSGFKNNSRSGFFIRIQILKLPRTTKKSVALFLK